MKSCLNNEINSLLMQLRAIFEHSPTKEKAPVSLSKENGRPSSVENIAEPSRQR